MKIRAVKNYTDKQLNKAIVVGDEYEVSLERANQIVNVGYAVVVLEEPIEEVVEVAKPKKTRKKKA